MVVIAGAIITLFLALLILFGFSGLAIWIPALGITVVGFFFLILAFVLPSEALQYRKGDFAISAKGVFAIIGAGILMVNFLGITLGNFFSGLFGSFHSIAPSAGTSDLVGTLETFGITPATVGQILVVLMGSIIAAVIVDKTFRRRIIKKL